MLVSRLTRHGIPMSCASFKAGWDCLTAVMPDVNDTIKGKDHQKTTKGDSYYHQWTTNL